MLVLSSCGSVQHPSLLMSGCVVGWVVGRFRHRKLEGSVRVCSSSILTQSAPLQAVEMGPQPPSGPPPKRQAVELGPQPPSGPPPSKAMPVPSSSASSAAAAAELSVDDYAREPPLAYGGFCYSATPNSQSAHHFSIVCTVRPHPTRWAIVSQALDSTVLAFVSPSGGVFGDTHSVCRSLSRSQLGFATFMCCNAFCNFHDPTWVR
jgi:hypothetical protein